MYCLFLSLILACASQDQPFTVPSAQAASPSVATQDSAEEEEEEEEAIAESSEVEKTLDDVREITVQSAIQEERATCIEHYLMDQLAVKEGKAPKNWVQPPFPDYCKAGAPSTFIPAPIKTTVAPSTVTVAAKP